MFILQQDNIKRYEKCQVQNADLSITFVDITKAFDTVSRGGHSENNDKI